MLGFALIFSLMIISSVSAWDVDITSPVNGSFHDSSVTSISYKLNNLNECSNISVWFNNGTDQKTTGCTSNGSEITVSNLDFNQDWNNWEIIVKNETSNITKNDSVSFWVDSIEPDLKFSSPSNYTNLNFFEINWSINETNKYDYGVNQFSKLWIWQPLDNYPNLLDSTIYAKISNEYYKHTTLEDLTQEGNYHYLVRIADKYPNDTKIRDVDFEGTIVRDVTSPTISINTPENNANLSGNFTIDVSANDSLSGMKNITIQLNNETNSSQIYYCNYSETCSWEIPSKQMQDGNYNITATAYDKAGNFRNKTITINVDNTAPIINITEPLNQTYNAADGHRTQLNYTLIEVHPEKCWFQTNVVSAGENFTNVSSVEGQNTWTIYCNDSAGNIGSANVSFYVDTILPNLTNSEILGGYFNGTTSYFSPENQDGNYEDLILNANASEIVNWSTIRIYNSTDAYVARFNSLAENKENQTLVKEWDLNLTMTTDDWATNGKYKLNATITDMVGNSRNIDLGGFYVDNNAPLITISPNDTTLEYLTESILINWSANDLNLKEAHLNVTNPSGSLIIQEATGNITINPNLLNETGVYTISVYAEDLVANTNISTTTFSVNDTTNPDLTYITKQVENDTSYSTERLINVSGFDLNEFSIYFIVNGTTKKRCNRENENIYCSYLLSGEGTYNITVLANDSEGNTNNSLEKTTNIKIDSTAPRITLNNPLENEPFAYEDNNITFNFNVIESNNYTCDLILNGNNISGVVSPHTENNLTIGKQHSWYVECIDDAGNVNQSETRYFTILSNTTYDGNYTNLTAESDISNVSNFYIENENGSINFTESIDFSDGSDWTTEAELLEGEFNLDSIFQKEVKLVFKNINLTRPEVLGDGNVICNSESCYNYNNSTDILSINITGGDVSSKYVVREYEEENNNNGGGSSGGGSSSPNTLCNSSEIDYNNCKWTKCIDGKMSQSCLNDCGEYVTTIENQDCIVSSSSSEEGENNEQNNNLEENENQDETTFQNAPITGGAIGGMGDFVKTTTGRIISIILSIAIIGAIGIGIRKYIKTNKK